MLVASNPFKHAPTHSIRGRHASTLSLPRPAQNAKAVAAVVRRPPGPLPHSTCDRAGWLDRGATVISCCWSQPSRFRPSCWNSPRCPTDCLIRLPTSYRLSHSDFRLQQDRRRRLRLYYWSREPHRCSRRLSRLARTRLQQKEWRLQPPRQVQSFSCVLLAIVATANSTTRIQFAQACAKVGDAPKRKKAAPSRRTGPRVSGRPRFLPKQARRGRDRRRSGSPSGKMLCRAPLSRGGIWHSR